MSLLEVAKWNNDRNGLVFNAELERNMLDEEAKEFQDGLKDYLGDSLFKLEAVVEMIDAYCDFNFVYTGTICKAIAEPGWVDEEKRMTYMNTFIIEALFKHGVTIFDGNGKSVIDEAMGFVIEANKAKPINKTSGKVTKGKDWKDPKELIKQVILDRGWDEDTEAVKAKREASRAKPTVAGTVEDFIATEGGQA